MTGLLILLGLLVVVSVLLTIAICGDAQLAAENRRLRAEVARRHPALRLIDSGSSDLGGAS